MSTPEARAAYPGPTGSHYATADEKRWHLDQLLRREGFDRGRIAALEEAAVIAEECRPEMGMHVNGSQYRSGKFDGLTIAADRIRKAKEGTP